MNSILILDDEAAVRQSLVDHFEDRCWRTLEAGSAEEAVKLLGLEQPDAAIVDIRLPGMDGNDFIRQLNQRSTSMVFVICTGSPEYLVPIDLQQLPNVSSRLIKKPVTNLDELEAELLRLMKNRGTQ